MFEGKPPAPDPRNARNLTEEQVGELRPVSWGELVARLAAARELRSALHGEEPGWDASFDADSARRIAARSDGKWSVNPEDSANGKPAEGTYRRSADDIISGDPRN